MQRAGAWNRLWIGYGQNRVASRNDSGVNSCCPEAGGVIGPAQSKVLEKTVQRQLDLINLKREHVKRLANQNGAAGEADVLAANVHYVARPKGRGLDVLMAALKESGVVVKRSSFDAIALPEASVVDFTEKNAVMASLEDMVFVEIKTANQARVRPDFSGFFFALTEGELLAAEALGNRHRVMLLNKATGTMLLTSVPEILARARSTNWQVSIQL